MPPQSRVRRVTDANIKKKDAIKFTDSLQYLEKSLDYKKVPFKNCVVDYSFTSVGYTAIVYNVKKAKGKVQILNTTFYTNIIQKTKFKDNGLSGQVFRTTFKRYGDFITMLSGMDALVMLTKSPTDPWLQTLIWFDKLTEDTEDFIRKGGVNNKYPLRWTPPIMDDESYQILRSKILKENYIRLPTGAKTTYFNLMIETGGAFDFERLKNYYKLMDTLGYKGRLAILCRNYGLDLL